MQSMKNTYQLLTVEEVAEFLGIHIMTAYKLLQTKRLPGTHIGGQWRVPRERLIEWIEKKAGKNAS